eukprot:3659956-Lingulodinium_polyedra.AAC.1
MPAMAAQRGKGTRGSTKRCARCCAGCGSIVERTTRTAGSARPASRCRSSAPQLRALRCHTGRGPRCVEGRPPAGGA